jgi:hypothetical protein
MTRWLLFFVISAASSLFTNADNLKEQDIAQMRRVLDALQRYEKEKGTLPSRLLALVPTFLPDRASIIPPSAEKRSAEEEREDEEDDDEWDPAGAFEFAAPFFGDGAPVLRGRSRDTMLNITRTGTVFEGGDHRTESPFVSEWLAKNLPPNRTLVITVKDETGKPIAGASINDGKFRTDDAGTVRLPCPPKGSNFLAVKKGYMTIGENWPRDVRSFAEGIERFKSPALEITMRTVNEGGGIVRGLGGKPLPGVSVMINQANNGSLTKTDAKGRWTIEFLPGVPFSVNLYHKDYCWFDGNEDDPWMPASLVIAGKSDFQMKPVATLGGIVVSGGQPVGGAVVYSKEPDAPYGGPKAVSVTTKNDGAFALKSQSEQGLNILVIAKGFAPAILKANAAGKNPQQIKVALDGGVRRKCRLVDGNMDPVANTPVLLAGSDRIRITEHPLIAMTDRDGSLVWEHAPAGTVTCAVASSDGKIRYIEWDCVPLDEAVLMAR